MTNLPYPNASALLRRNLILLCAAIAITSCVPAPDLTELDNDIQVTESKIADTERELASYAGGAIKAILETKLAYETTSLAALRLKRDSLITFVTFTYPIPEELVFNTPDASISSLEADIRKVISERNAAQAESDRYSGGLIKVMKEMEVATNEATLAALEMRRLTLKWGIPSLQKSEDGPAPDKPAQFFDDEAL